MIALAGAIVFGLVAPHLWPKSWLHPSVGIALWIAVLSLRALVVILAVALFVLYVPTTHLFHLLTHWCLHAVLPFLAVHLGLSGHSLGGVAILLPALVLAISITSCIFALWRTARMVSRFARSANLGAGPRRSVVVGGREVLMAAAGLRRPEVLVSTGALTHLDDEELAAGLEHEWGHIERRHRYVAVLAQVLCSVARLLPGTRAARAQFHLALERDADEFAVRRTGDPLALASAICKSAGSRFDGSPLIAALGGSASRARLEPLLDRGYAPGPLAGRCSLVLVATVFAMSIALLVAVPAAAAAGIEQLSGAHLAPACQ